MEPQVPSAPPVERARRLDDPRRLQTQVSEADLARILSLAGTEDLLDLGSGTGFYTDRMAALTQGLVYASRDRPGSPRTPPRAGRAPQRATYSR